MSNNINELPEGGWGITIMSNIADRLSYTRTSDEKNCLSIVKNYGVDKQQPGDIALRKIHLQVHTDINALTQVLDGLKQLENLPLTQQFFGQVQILITEGFTNVVRHAHQGLPSETPIDIEIRVFNESLEIRVWDYGQPFDLEAKLREQIEEGGRNRSISNLPKLADQVS